MWTRVWALLALLSIVGGLIFGALLGFGADSLVGNIMLGFYAGMGLTILTGIIIGLLSIIFAKSA
jgi:hypothetical protein